MIIDFEAILRRKKSYTTEVAQAIEEEYNKSNIEEEYNKNNIEEEYNKSNIEDEMNRVSSHDHPGYQMIQNIYD